MGRSKKKLGAMLVIQIRGKREVKLNHGPGLQKNIWDRDQSNKLRVRNYCQNN